MRNYTGLKTQVDYALQSNDEKRQELLALLNKTGIEDNTVLIDGELLSRLYARLGNDSLVMQKLLDEVRHLQMELHVIKNQE
jgi:hypothetical protein